MIDDRISTEFEYAFTRSSGAGGQHVNKVSTRVEARFRIEQSNYLKEEEKLLVMERLANAINTKGELIFTSQRYRSQLQNKIDVTNKLLESLEKALHIKKKRLNTRPSKSSKERRLLLKKQHSIKKAQRRNTSEF